MNYNRLNKYRSYALIILQLSYKGISENVENRIKRNIYWRVERQNTACKRYSKVHEKCIL